MKHSQLTFGGLQNDHCSVTLETVLLDFQSRPDGRLDGRVDPSVRRGGVLARKEYPSLSLLQYFFVLILGRDQDVGIIRMGSWVEIKVWELFVWVPRYEIIICMGTSVGIKI